MTQEYHIILQQPSTTEIIVSHDGQATVVKSDWVLLSFPPDELDPWRHVRISVGKSPRHLEFEIVFPNHKKQPLQDQYLNNLRAFVDTSRSALPRLRGLDLHDIRSPISQAPVFKDVFHVIRTEGRGAHGVVDQVVSLRNGRSFARKSFFEPTPQTGEKRRRRAREEWLWRIRNEVNLMKNNSHLIDFQERPRPAILMPYYPHGSIEKFAGLHSLRESQYLLAFFQLLTALDHLHSRGVAHRDVKPQNILVTEVNPFTIVLSDFGVSKFRSRRSPLESFCGTECYAAPEIFPGKCPAEGYTVAVDIWSAGVMMLDWAFGYPESPRWASSQQGLEYWWKALVRKVDGCKADDEVRDILKHMVVMEPKDRFSARQCIEKGYQNGLFHVDEDSQRILVRTRTCEDERHGDPSTECGCHRSNDNGRSAGSAEAPVNEVLASPLENRELDSELYLAWEASSLSNSPARKRRKLAPRSQLNLPQSSDSSMSS
ncbi:hypothetical protein SAPIO_CDS4022 [Scedosporium apiospermum]|uniref:Protein kinase domain-containing protein n=1 Tax=Pseudallescheria apiosperma TaxID=563466 RepID=A0A084G944_PSEDA|nr:uncharacterized protein SAPIO_CDS4022 [Scedosporium apiospermum]KEZ43856.1 hypothetical protein SAPIO_CDS4022 [Scedosporium apiospermum]